MHSCEQNYMRWEDLLLPYNVLCEEDIDNENYEIPLCGFSIITGSSS